MSTFVLVTAAPGRGSIFAICKLAVTPSLCVMLQHMLEAAFLSLGCLLCSSRPCLKITFLVHPYVEEVHQPALSTGAGCFHSKTAILPRRLDAFVHTLALQPTGVGFDEAA